MNSQLENALLLFEGVALDEKTQRPTNEDCCLALKTNLDDDYALPMTEIEPADMKDVSILFSVGDEEFLMIDRLLVGHA